MENKSRWKKFSWMRRGGVGTAHRWERQSLTVFMNSGHLVKERKKWFIMFVIRPIGWLAGCVCTRVASTHINRYENWNCTTVKFIKRKTFVCLSTYNRTVALPISFLSISSSLCLCRSLFNVERFDRVHEAVITIIYFCSKNGWRKI